ncbi:hypothetical protein [Desulfosporosinus metallidurans]|uniref:DUF2933 domain-containing protein n=1 Tax=Desulfosporosinus metallidurans TaxID=1888891 RepID=A0A1Q8QN96_9FIRM|nr:hypothetical protein [Desulfosporosinus metallidurans]OLN28790.1 hypothetical protein DSOL_3867 [Desulfosporosinus metallidurans]
MGQFFNQYGWYLFMFGIMFFMHRRGAGGCCGGHEHDQHNQNDQSHQQGTKQSVSFEPKN